MLSSKTRNPRRSLVAASHRVGILSLVQHLERVDDQPLYILAYHRVDEPARAPYLDPSLLSATPAQFLEQMRFIAERYCPVSAEQVIDAVTGGTPLPADAVLVTVDDGYRDFAENIFQAAQHYSIRPVLFIPTGYVGKGSFWWDQVYCAVRFAVTPALETPLGTLPVDTPENIKGTLERLRACIKQAAPLEACRVLEQLQASVPREVAERERSTLTWDELRALDRAGVTIAAHTHTHPILSRIPLEEARREIRGSQAAIAREIGHSLPIFAFPDGKPGTFNEDVIRILGEEGFRVVVTMNEGRARLKYDNLLSLPRLGMSTRMSLAQFHLHLTPVYSRWKRSLG